MSMSIYCGHIKLIEYFIDEDPTWNMNELIKGARTIQNLELVKYFIAKGGNLEQHKIDILM